MSNTHENNQKLIAYEPDIRLALEKKLAPLGFSFAELKWSDDSDRTFTSPARIKQGPIMPIHVFRTDKKPEPWTIEASSYFFSANEETPAINFSLAIKVNDKEVFLYASNWDKNLLNNKKLQNDFYGTPFPPAEKQLLIDAIFQGIQNKLIPELEKPANALIKTRKTRDILVKVGMIILGVLGSYAFIYDFTH